MGLVDEDEQVALRAEPARDFRAKFGDELLAGLVQLALVVAAAELVY